MERNDYVNVRKLLVIGFIASVVTVLGGELPIGWVEYPESDNYIMSMLLSCRDLSVFQLACGMFFGGICIPLQYYGFEAVSRIVTLGGSQKAGKLIHWGALATAFWGGIVHIICVALMFLCRVTEIGLAIPGSILDFTLWLVMPISVVFMPIYYIMTVVMAVVIGKGRTVLPKWAAVFNPLTATLVLNALPMFLSGAFVNALGMANMGIGSVLTFGGILWLLKKK